VFGPLLNAAARESSNAPIDVGAVQSCVWLRRPDTSRTTGRRRLRVPADSLDLEQVFDCTDRPRRARSAKIALPAFPPIEADDASRPPWPYENYGIVGRAGGVAMAETESRSRGGRVGSGSGWPVAVGVGVAVGGWVEIDVGIEKGDAPIAVRPTTRGREGHRDEDDARGRASANTSRHVRRRARRVPPWETGVSTQRPQSNEPVDAVAPVCSRAVRPVRCFCTRSVGSHSRT